MTQRDQGPTAILLLACPNQRGLVATVSDFIYQHQGDIVHADQYTDMERGYYLQRVEWDLTNFTIPREKIADAFHPIAKRFGMEWNLSFSDHRPRIAIFVSQEQHCLMDLLARWQMGEFPADLALVISNHNRPQHAVEQAGFPFYHFPITTDTKPQQEAAELAILQELRIDYIILARYMQVLSEDFIAHYPNRIINIHHSFLPAFAGARPYHQAYQRGVKLIGATAHYATTDLDEGPIIEQDGAKVSHRDTVDDMIRKGRDLEKVVLARAVRMHLLHRVLVYENKTVVFE